MRNRMSFLITTHRKNRRYEKLPNQRKVYDLCETSQIIHLFNISCINYPKSSPKHNTTNKKTDHGFPQSVSYFEPLTPSPRDHPIYLLFLIASAMFLVTAYPIPATGHTIQDLPQSLVQKL